MKLKLLILLVLASIGVQAQFTNFNSYGLQRKIVGTDTTWRFVGSGSNGFRSFNPLGALTDSTVFRTVLNSYSLSAMQTKLNNYTLQTRTITPGFGLSGFGNFTANRTGSVDTTQIRSVLNSYTKAQTDAKIALATPDSTIFRTTANSYTLANLQAKLNNYVLGTRSITAGLGLSGGGNLTVDRTVNADTTYLRTVANSLTKAQAQAKYNLYAPLNGTGTSGTWPISISGNAATWATIPFTGVGAANSVDYVFGYDAVTTGSAKILTVANFATTLGLQNYIPLTQKATALGVATLDASGKVPSSQLPAGAAIDKGNWNATTNTPTLADGVGTAGWIYYVEVGGTQNLGSGSITFVAGDYVAYNGSIWQKRSSGVLVNSVNGYTGAVVLTLADVGGGNLDNTSDLNKPISTATQTALNLKQNQLNGTGFVKASGTTISYDNSTYLTTTSASSTYQTLANLSNTTTLGTSTSLYPTQNAVKTYVDNAISGVGGGTVTLFSKTDNFGIVSSITNATTTPNHAIAVDSTTVRTVANSFTKAQTNTQISNAIGGLSLGSLAYLNNSNAVNLSNNVTGYATTWLNAGTYLSSGLSTMPNNLMAWDGSQWRPATQTGAQLFVDINTGATLTNSVSGSAGSVAWANVTGKPTFATVATTGDYNDLINRPTLNISDWNTAYSQTRQWNGGATGLVASTGRTSLGGTTVGQNLFTLSNPSAISFLRVNADNSVDALSASAFRTAIGAGSSSTTGTVTSVGTGYGLTGGAITGAGTIVADTTQLMPKVNSYTLAQMQTKLNNYALTSSLGASAFEATTLQLARNRSNSITSTGTGSYTMQLLGNTGATNIFLAGQTGVSNGFTVKYNGTNMEYDFVDGNVTAPTFIGALTGNASTATNIAWTGVTGKPTFATVATSGDYNDLINKPTLTSGTVTSVSSPNIDINVGSATTTPVLTLNSSVAASANTIPKRDSNGDLVVGVSGVRIRGANSGQDIAYLAGTAGQGNHFWLTDNGTYQAMSLATNGNFTLTKYGSGNTTPTPTGTEHMLTVDVNGLLGHRTIPTQTFTSLTTTGTSGPAILSSGVLNIPQYSSVTNLSLGTPTSTTYPITNSNGTGFTLPSATTSVAGLMSAADKTKSDNQVVITSFTTSGTGPASLSGGNLNIPTPNLSAYMPLSGGAFSGAVTSSSSISASGGFFDTSDIRLKHVQSYSYDASKIEAITYRWKNIEDGKSHVGYSAQQVQKYMPHAVKTDDKGYLSVNYTEVLVQKVAQLEAKIKALEARK